MGGRDMGPERGPGGTPRPRSWPPAAQRTPVWARRGGALVYAAALVAVGGLIGSALVALALRLSEVIA